MAYFFLEDEETLATAFFEGQKFLKIQTSLLQEDVLLNFINRHAIHMLTCDQLLCITCFYVSLYIFIPEVYFLQGSTRHLLSAAFWFDAAGHNGKKIETSDFT